MSYSSHPTRNFTQPQRPQQQSQRFGGSMGGGNQMALFEGRNSHDRDSWQTVDYSFVKKLTLALEELSLAREGRVEYSDSSGSESSTPPSSAVAPTRVNARRFNIPLLSLTDPKDTKTSYTVPGAK